jgi:hypothetical protein
VKAHGRIPRGFDRRIAYQKYLGECEGVSASN